VHSYILYISPELPSTEIDTIKDLLEKIRTKHNISYEIVDGSQLNPDEKEALADSLRRISNKKQIRIRSSGGGALPISRSGAVNFGNIPILLRLDDERSVDVYPHEAGAKGQRFEVLKHLTMVLTIDHIADLQVETALSEQDISKIISNFPTLIEDGLEFMEIEVPIKGAQIDAVFKDKTGKHLLVEIELKVTDGAIGQVLKFLGPYSQKFGVFPQEIRRALVCVDISENQINTCKVEGIEVYKFTIQKYT